MVGRFVYPIPRAVLDSGTYRLKSVFTLTDRNGKNETITIYSHEQKIG